MPNLDSVIDSVSGNGKYQMKLLCLAFYANIASALNIIASLFTAGAPDLRCFIEGVDDSNNFNLTESEILDIFVPLDDSQKLDTCRWKDFKLKENCNNSLSSYNDCAISLLNGTNYKLSTCNNGYIYDQSVYTSTVVTEWDLVCSNEIYITLSTSLFYLGFFIGAAVGGLVSDRFGRIFTYRLGAIGGLVLGVGASFSQNIIVYSVLRISQIVMFYQSTLSSIVYGVEISKKSWRTMSGLVCNFAFGIGCILLSAVALLCNDWRQIQIAVSCSFIISIFITFFLPESPRWLCSKFNYDEAEMVLKKMARGNQVEFDDHLWQNLLQDDEDTKGYSPASSENTMTILKGLFSRYYSRNLLLSNMSVWMITSLVYFGLILNSGNIGFNVYLSNALGGLMESLSCIVSIFVSIRYGCRRFIVVNLVLSSIACLVSTVIIQCGENFEGAQTTALVMAMAGRFGASAVFGTLFLQTMELFPTCGRTTALGMSSMAARIGSIISPWTVQAQRAIPWLSQAIFGTTTLFAAFLVFQFPETRNRNLKMTFSEAESSFQAHFSKSKLSCCKRKRLNDCEELKSTQQDM